MLGWAQYKGTTRSSLGRVRQKNWVERSLLGSAAVLNMALRKHARSQASHFAAEVPIHRAIYRAKCEVLAVPGAH